MKLTRPLALFFAISLSAMVAVSCGGTNCKDPANAASAQCSVTNAVVTCGGSSLGQLVDEQLPQFGHELGSAILGDGSIDYNAATPVLESYAVKFGMCFVSDIIGKLGSLHFAAAPGVTATPHATPKALADTLEKFRATHYTGIKFVSGGGQ